MVAVLAEEQHVGEAHRGDGPRAVADGAGAVTLPLAPEAVLATAEVGGGDRQRLATIEAVATVNRVNTPIAIDLAKATGEVEIEIRNANTGEILLSGMGETGRAALQLTVTEIP